MDPLTFAAALLGVPRFSSLHCRSLLRFQIPISRAQAFTPPPTLVSPCSALGSTAFLSPTHSNNTSPRTASTLAAARAVGDSHDCDVAPGSNGEDAGKARGDSSNNADSGGDADDDVLQVEEVALIDEDMLKFECVDDDVSHIHCASLPVGDPLLRGNERGHVLGVLLQWALPRPLLALIVFEPSCSPLPCLVRLTAPTSSRVGLSDVTRRGHSATTLTPSWASHVPTSTSPAPAAFIANSCRRRLHYHGTTTRHAGPCDDDGRRQRGRRPRVQQRRYVVQRVASGHPRGLRGLL